MAIQESNQNEVNKPKKETLKSKRRSRYCLISKNKKIRDINYIIKDGALDLTKVILIDIPNEKREEVQLNIPKSLRGNNRGSQTYELKSKKLLSEIDLFLFQHSEKGAEDVRNYLCEELKYEIPRDYDFWIVYLSKGKDQMKTYKFLEPIYAEAASIVLWLKEMAQEEYANQGVEKITAFTRMQNNLAWQKVFKSFVVEDIKGKGRMIDCFDSWVDTRGAINGVRKRNVSANFQEQIKRIQETETNKNLTESDQQKRLKELKKNLLDNIKKYPLSNIMQTCRRYQDEPYVWEILKHKLSNYKEMRGYLLCRYLYKRKELENECEDLFRKSKALNCEEEKRKYPIDGVFEETDIRVYDVLRYSDYTMEEMEEQGMIPENLLSIDRGIRKTIEQKIKWKREKDEKHYTDTHVKRNGKVEIKRTYIEHEEEMMCPEDYKPIYSDPDMQSDSDVQESNVRVLRKR